MALLTKECIDKLNHSIPLVRYLTRSSRYPKEYNCPYCESTHHVEYYPETNLAHCAKCDTSFNLIQLRQHIENKDFMEIAKEISEQEGIALEYDRTEPQDARKPSFDNKGGKSTLESDKTDLRGLERATEGNDSDEGKPNTPNLYREYILQCAGNVTQTDYFIKRGLSPGTVKKFNLGFDPEKNVVILPYSNEFSYYATRRINAGHTDKNRYWKPKTDEAGTEPVFNVDALYNGEPCFICESQIDAVSIGEIGGNAVSLGGGGSEKLIKQLTKKPTDSPIILCFDNDDQGRDDHEKTAEKLDKIKVNYTTAHFTLDRYDGEKEDCNDLLKANRAQFEKDIKENIKNAIPQGEIGAFLHSIYSEKYKPTSTGIFELDHILHGGLIPGTLTLIGAPPGTGKTCLCTQIFENFARAGRPCLYFNLEMSKEQLLARAVSRQAYKDGNFHLDACDVLQGYRQNNFVKETVKTCAERYGKEVSPCLEYAEINSTNYKNIMEYAKTRAEENRKAGKPAPCLAIDYLHLLTSDEKDDPAEILKKAVFELKQYAIEYNAIVIAIMAQSRRANDSKYATMSSGRDTSGLEYSCDIQLQLIRNNSDDPDEVQLYVTKSRFTASNMKDALIMTLHGDVNLLEPQGTRKRTDSKPKATTRTGGKKKRRYLDDDEDDEDDDELNFD